MITADASAIVKLIIDEQHSDLARQRMDLETEQNEPIYVPDTALAEVMNVIWKYSTLKNQKAIEPSAALADLFLLWNKLTVIRTGALAQTAMEIAVGNKITIYDALYAALSKVYGAPLLTFDRKLSNKASKIGIKLVPL